jgi:hypothetical protein
MTDAKEKTAKEKQRERTKRWREEKREHIREYQAAWRAKNADHVKAYNVQYMTDYYNREDAAKSRWLRNLKNYNLTAEDFNAMWCEQDGKCAICRHEMKPRGRTKDAVAVDHNHDTGEVRGLLCRGCNHGIGNLKDDPEVLIRAAEYLTAKGHYARSVRHSK